MKADELEKFCVENAGALAAGKDKDGNSRKGRIVAYMPGKMTSWILLEDTKLPKSKTPSVLPSMPYLFEKWYRVVGDCHLGSPCIASTVNVFIDKIEVKGAVKVIPEKEEPAPIVNTIKRKCGHTECHVDWCWMKYAGFV